MTRATALLAILMFGLMAGFFYAWSVSVMPGFALIPPEQAVPAMQAVNVAVRNAAFGAAFFLSPVVALIAAGLLLRAGRGRAAALMGAAALVYLGGALALTVAVNVPMNEALAPLTPADAAEAAAIWAEYAPRWTFWNHVRGFAALGALALAALALRAEAAGGARGA